MNETASQRECFFHSRGWETEIYKTGAQYALMLIASLVAGWLLPRFLSDSILDFFSKSVLTHFRAPLSYVSGAAEIVKMILRFFIPNFVCVFVIFLFSFSALRCFMTDLILIWLGARTGCTMSVLWSLSFQSRAEYTLTPRFFFFAVLFRIVLLGTVFVFSMFLTKHAYVLRVNFQSGKNVLAPRTVISMVCGFLGTTVALAILHLAYCILISR